MASDESHEPQGQWPTQAANSG